MINVATMVRAPADRQLPAGEQEVCCSQAVSAQVDGAQSDCLCKEQNPQEGNCMPCVNAERGSQRTLPLSAVSQLPSAKKYPPAPLARSGAAYPDPCLQCSSRLDVPAATVTSSAAPHAHFLCSALLCAPPLSL